LSYFGEYMDKDCGFCDNCMKPTARIRIQEEAVLILKAIQQTDQRFDGDHIADIITATDNIYVTSYEHDKLEMYGAGKYKDNEEEESIENGVEFWRSMIRQLVVLGYLQKDPENFGVLKLSEKGTKYITDPYPITISKNHTFDESELQKASEEDDSSDMAPAGGGNAYDGALLGLLKALRKKLAKERNLPPYVIFQDPSLEEMATTYPTAMQEMAQINGVGMGKVQKFGKPFIDLITKYVDENEIETAKDVVVKSAANKSKVKIFIIQQIDRKVDLDEIAGSKSLAMDELIEEIEHICYSGTKLNLDYYINQIMDRNRQHDIYDYFMTAESDSIKTALEDLREDDVSEEELRLMRIKFLSEVAN